MQRDESQRATHNPGGHSMGGLFCRVFVLSDYKMTSCGIRNNNIILSLSVANVGRLGSSDLLAELVASVIGIHVQ